MKSPEKKRPRQTVKIEVTRQQWDDLLSAVTFTQGYYEKTREPAPEFMKALEILRKKMWRMKLGRIE